MSYTPQIIELANGTKCVSLDDFRKQSMNAAQFLSEKTKAMSELEKAQNQLSQIHRWIERHNQDGCIDSLTYPQNLDRCVDALYDKLEIAIARKQ